MCERVRPTFETQHILPWEAQMHRSLLFALLSIPIAVHLASAHEEQSSSTKPKITTTVFDDYGQAHAEANRTQKPVFVYVFDSI